MEAKPGFLGQLSTSVLFSDVSHEEFLFTCKPVPASCWGPLAADRPALLSLREPRVALTKPRTRLCQATRFKLTESPRGPKGSQAHRRRPPESGLYPARIGACLLPGPTRALPPESCGSLEPFRPEGRVSVEKELIGAWQQRRLSGTDNTGGAWDADSPERHARSPRLAAPTPGEGLTQTSSHFIYGLDLVQKTPRRLLLSPVTTRNVV